MLVKTEKNKPVKIFKDNTKRFWKPRYVYKIVCSIFLIYIRIIFTVLILVLDDEIE